MAETITVRPQYWHGFDSLALEVVAIPPDREAVYDEVCPGVFVVSDEDTDEIRAFEIHDCLKRVNKLSMLLSQLPFRVRFEHDRESMSLATAVDFVASVILKAQDEAAASRQMVAG